MSTISNTGFVVLYVMTIDWTSTIIGDLVSKGFSVSAGFDSDNGKIYSSNDLDKISRVICLRIQKEKGFTRDDIQKVVTDILKSNNINTFGGIVSLDGTFNIVPSTIEKSKIDHPYR